MFLEEVLADFQPAPEDSTKLIQVTQFYFKSMFLWNNYKETPLAMHLIKITARSSFTRLRIIEFVRQINELH